MVKRKRQASAATRARLKALRKKHGLGEFKKSHSQTRKRVAPMARRRRVRRSVRRAYRRARSPTLNPMNLAMGAGVTAIGEPILDSLLSKYTGGGIMQEGAKTALGYFMAKKMKSPIAKSAGVALMVIGIRNIVKPMVGGFIPASTGVATGFNQTVF